MFMKEHNSYRFFHIERTSNMSSQQGSTASKMAHTAIDNPPPTDHAFLPILKPSHENTPNRKLRIPTALL